MVQIPNSPFLTVDFSPKGGGIDFLGMRLVNLNILAEHLIPGINNATTDMGTYFLGTWIPWKFKQLCKRQLDFTLSNFTGFREAIEVAISLSMRDDSPAIAEYGRPRNRIGVDQKISLPSKLAFKKANRTNSTSIYAAPLYGPSLGYLGLIAGYAVAEDGSSTGILLAAEDQGTLKIVKEVESLLKESLYFDKINKPNIPSLSYEAVDDLGIRGLNPATLTFKSNEAKRAFAAKLLYQEEGQETYPRTLTASLIVETLSSHSFLTADQLRRIWYTSLYDDGKRFESKEKKINVHRELWSIFMARQNQRFILELFLRCFELGLKSGCRSVDEVVGYFEEFWKKSSFETPSNFAEVIKFESRWLGSNGNYGKISKAWNNQVHGSHDFYEMIDFMKDEEECIRACRMLARWWIRMFSWIENGAKKDLLQLGGIDRISIQWFFEWVKEKIELPLGSFLKGLFSQFIFAQHMRIALARFDGHVQRLRFILGDKGIEPTSSALASLGKNQPPWMADRLNAFVGLLCDLSILEMDDEGKLTLGNNAGYLKQ